MSHKTSNALVWRTRARRNINYSLYLTYFRTISSVKTVIAIYIALNFS